MTRALRAGAGDCFCLGAIIDEMDVRSVWGCGVGVLLDHGEVEDATLSARGPFGMGEAVDMTVGFTIRYSFLSVSVWALACEIG